MILSLFFFKKKILFWVPLFSMAHVFTLLPGRDSLDTGQDCRGLITAPILSSLWTGQPLPSGVLCPTAAEGFIVWREDHKKPGQFRDFMRRGFEGRGVDMVGLWEERLGTWLWSHPFHTQAQAGMLPADNHNHSSLHLSSLSPPRNSSNGQRHKPCPLPIAGDKKKLLEFSFFIIFSVWYESDVNKAILYW